MTKIGICDYSDYDYKAEFWLNKNREYEHLLETQIIETLLNQFVDTKDKILDAGCGFGRLIPSYEHLFKKCHLVDYANQLVEQAKENRETNDKFKFYTQSLYELNIESNVNAIISIRTLHHLQDLNQLFRKYNEALTENGTLILDVPNYYHLKNKLKHPMRAKEPMTKLSENFFNYDPSYVIQCLKNNNFEIVTKRQLGMFRIQLIKRYIPAKLLVSFELFLNFFIKRLDISPSVYVVARKCG